MPQTLTTDLDLGDSLCINGVCLTATHLDGRDFTADVMPETFKRTTLSALTVGTNVNLERALPANGRFEGHIVQGHVDGVGRISRRWQDENAIFLRIDLPAALRGQVVTKGAIAIDGTSLTVVAAQSSWFTVSLIPQTQADTILAVKRIGAAVNLEIDVLYRYLHSMKGSTAHDNTY